MSDSLTPPVPADPVLVAGYLRFSEALQAGVPPLTPEMDALDRAYSQVKQSIRRGPPATAWALVRAILAQAPDARLGLYAAGPLEDLVRHWGGQLLETLLAEAAADERFRWALGGIWLSARDLPRPTLERLVAASEGRLKVAEWGVARPAAEPEIDPA